MKFFVISFCGSNKHIGSCNHYGSEDFQLSVLNLKGLYQSSLSPVCGTLMVSLLCWHVTVYHFNFSNSGESVMISQYDLAEIFLVYNKYGRAIFICLLALGKFLEHFH